MLPCIGHIDLSAAVEPFPCGQLLNDYSKEVTEQRRGRLVKVLLYVYSPPTYVVCRKVMFSVVCVCLFTGRSQCDRSHRPPLVLALFPYHMESAPTAAPPPPMNLVEPVHLGTTPRNLFASGWLVYD